MAGASVNELVKEREGAPLSLPHSFGPFLNLFPSFFEATLIVKFSLMRVLHWSAMVMIQGRALLENTVVMILYDNTTTITSTPSSTPQVSTLLPTFSVGG